MDQYDHLQDLVHAVVALITALDNDDGVDDDGHEVLSREVRDALRKLKQVIKC